MNRRIGSFVSSVLVASSALAVCPSQFRAPAEYATTANRMIRVADLDGDGAPDVVISGNQVDELSAFSVFRNLGDGTFAAERFIPTAFGERIEDIADLNGDGIADLVSANYWALGISVYLGKGSLQFDSGTAYPTAIHGGPTRVVDFDADGIPDLVSFSFGSGNPVRVHLFRGRGNGTFEPKMTTETVLANADTPSFRRIGGTLQSLTSDHTSQLGLLSYTNGSVSVSTIAAGPLDLASTFADVNGDGVADIVDTAQAAPTDTGEPVYVTLGNADGTFGGRAQLRGPRKLTFPVQVQTADLDRDGHLDLIVCDFGATVLYWFRGHGDGSFDPAVAIDAGAPVNGFAIADVNRDGFPDLVTTNDDHTFSVLINRGTCEPRRRIVAH